MFAKLVISTLLFGLASASWAIYSSSIQLELGGLWQQRNVVKISPQTGSRVAFDRFDRGPFLHFRGEAHVWLKPRHRIRLIAAPLSFDVESGLGRSFEFNGTSFSSDTPTRIEYRFNSYRLGYTYHFYKTEQLDMSAGITGKVRHARIRFSQGPVASEYANVGFVPLLYFSAKRTVWDQWTLYSDIDFAIAPQGRAFDWTLKMRRDLSDSFAMGAGYRMLEGGADNEKVYNFSWFHYGFLELLANF